MQLHIIHNPDRRDRYETLMKELSEQDIKEYKLWNSIHDVRSAHIGVNKAHKQIVQYAKENTLKEIYIAEDDIQFFDKGAWEYYLQQKPLDFDLWLGGIFLGEIKNGIVNKFTGLTLYTISESFYDTFLDVPETEHIDIGINEKGLFKVCNPFVVRQYNGFSQNENRYSNYDFIFQNREIYKSA